MRILSKKLLPIREPVINIFRKNLSNSSSFINYFEMSPRQFQSLLQLEEILSFWNLSELPN